MVALLAADLTTDITFTIEVVPPRGAVLFIHWTTTAPMESTNSLGLRCISQQAVVFGIGPNGVNPGKRPGRDERGYHGKNTDCR